MQTAHEKFIEEVTEKSVVQKVDSPLLQAAYDYCKAITINHYENFPVASVLAPKKLRPAIQAIYAFSRLADDFADERAFRHVRIERLEEWEHFLHQKNSTHPVFIALQDTIQKHDLPLGLLEDLLTAFKMDTYKKRYQTFDDVLHYCRYSANPVGRLILHLFRQDTSRNLQHSDFICTALQITNFWQDVSVDLKKDRIYIPQEDLDRFNYTSDELFRGLIDERYKMLMNFQVERAFQYFDEGHALGLDLNGMLGLEIRLTWLTGRMILKKIRKINYDVFNKRPTLSKWDFVKLFFIALSKPLYARQKRKSKS